MLTAHVAAPKAQDARGAAAQACSRSAIGWVLSASEYKPVLRSSYITGESGRQLDKLLLDVTVAEFGPGFKPASTKLYGDLKHDFKGGKTLDNIVSILGMTCKTHKLQGEVVGRALHTSAKSPLKPVLRYISFCCGRL